MPRKRVYSYDKRFPDGTTMSIRLPKMNHLRANVTYVCDRKCPSCNRMCNVAPSWSGENLSPEAFQKALDGVKKAGLRLTKLVLTGGEPSLHPGFDDLAAIAMDYKNSFAPECVVWVSTYQHPVMFKRVLAAMKRHPGLLLMGGPKTVPRVHDYSPCMAPIDMPDFIQEGHRYRGCHLNGSLCGMTVDYKGFYCCPVAGGIARVFGLDFAIPDFSGVTRDALTDQYDVACRLCGYYLSIRSRGRERISPTWKSAIEAYRRQTE